MAPKELSVWDVMNGVSEEDAKQDDNIVFAKARRIVTKPYGRTWGLGRNLTRSGIMWDGETNIPLGSARLSEAAPAEGEPVPENTGSYRNLIVGYPLLDTTYPVDEDEVDQVIHTRVVRLDLNTGERRMLDPRYVLRIYDDHYELLEETSGRRCEISAERLLYEQDDAPPSACVTPSGEVLRFDEVTEVAQPH